MGRLVPKDEMGNYSGRGVVGVALYWWNEILNSEQWQQGFFYSLCACYSLVALVALVQLSRIQMRVPEYGWTTQKIFHLMNFVVNGLRAILFGFYKTVFLLKPKVSIWVYARLSQKLIAVKLAKLFVSVISFFAALGFLIYGGRLFVMLRRFPIESKGRQKKLNEVGAVTGICCMCFLIRCVVVTLSAFDKDADLFVLSHAFLNFVYYMLVEILPCSLVLFILRKLPPRRISDRYHPIQ